MRGKIPKKTSRRAFSFLELQVALVLLGIALVGFVPLVVMQAKQLKRLEGRLRHDTQLASVSPGEAYYLVPATDHALPVGERLIPQTDLWMRKLGAPATIELREEPTSPVAPSLSPEQVYDVNVLWFNKSFTPATVETVEARVQLTEIPSS